MQYVLCRTKLNELCNVLLDMTLWKSLHTVNGNIVLKQRTNDKEELKCITVITCNHCVSLMCCQVSTDS